MLCEREAAETDRWEGQRLRWQKAEAAERNRQPESRFNPGLSMSGRYGSGVPFVKDDPAGKGLAASLGGAAAAQL